MGILDWLFRRKSKKYLGESGIIDPHEILFNTPPDCLGKGIIELHEDHFLYNWATNFMEDHSFYFKKGDKIFIKQNTSLIFYRIITQNPDKYTHWKVEWCYLPTPWYYNNPLKMTKHI